MCLTFVGFIVYFKDVSFNSIFADFKFMVAGLGGVEISVNMQSVSVYNKM